MFKSCLAAQNNSNEPAEENLLWLISGIGPTSSFEPVTPESLTAVLRKAEWPDFSRLCRRSVRSSRSSFCFSSRTMASHSCSFLLASQVRARTSSVSSFISASVAEFELEVRDDASVFDVRLSRTRMVDF